jgi:hypothetical protein
MSGPLDFCSLSPYKDENTRVIKHDIGNPHGVDLLPWIFGVLKFPLPSVILSPFGSDNLSDASVLGN